MIQKITQIIDGVVNTNEGQGIGLLNGDSGIALFYYYCSLLSNKEYQDKCQESIQQVLEQINNGATIGTFCSGIAGFGWTLEFLREKGLFVEEDIELLDDLDDFLFRKMISEFSKDHYDYLHGAIGYGLYFLKRLRKNKSVDYLAELVNQLDKMSEKDSNDIIKWESTIDHENGTKGFNISLSHGMASIVAVLTRIYQAGIEKEKCKELVTGAVEYILKQEIDKDIYNSYFPSMSLENHQMYDHGSRLAWCYGDLGIAMSIYQAGVAFNNSHWIDKSIEVLTYSTTRKDLQKNTVIDAGLCHGAAGIGHIFNRMYWNTKLPEFKTAAQYWFEVTLKMAYHEDGLAGYKAWHTPEYGGWQNKANILDGVAGIGLAFMSFYHEIEPSWDECLLLS